MSVSTSVVSTCIIDSAPVTFSSSPGALRRWRVRVASGVALAPSGISVGRQRTLFTVDSFVSFFSADEAASFRDLLSSLAQFFFALSRPTIKVRACNSQSLAVLRPSGNNNAKFHSLATSLSPTATTTALPRTKRLERHRKLNCSRNRKFSSLLTSDQVGCSYSKRHLLENDLPVLYFQHTHLLIDSDCDAAFY